MSESGFQCLTRSEEECLLDCYLERVGQKDGVSIVEFREIVMGFRKFHRNQSHILELLEKVKKKIKERSSGISENDIVIRKNYFLLSTLILNFRPSRIQ